MKRQSGVLKAGLLAAAATLATLGLSQPSLAQDKVTLRMSTWLPEGHHLSQSLLAWSAQIDEASGGSLVISFDGGALAKPPGQYDVARDGIADMAYPVLGYTPGRFTIMRGTELPFLSPSAEVGSQAAWDWYQRNVGTKEFPDTTLITAWVHGPGQLHTKDEVTKLDDLDGVKLRVGGGGVAMSEALGAVPVAMSAPDSHEALLRGTADGTLFPWEAIAGFKLTDLVKYHLEVPGGLYATPFALVMNTAKFDKLSPEHQAILREYGGLAGAKFIGRRWDEADQKGRAEAEANGNTIQTLSPDEVELWREKVSFMADEWIEKADKEGWDGAALLSDLRTTIEKYAATN